MTEILLTMPHDGVNFDQLTAELRSQFSDAKIGLSTRPFRATDVPRDVTQGQLQAVVDAHDAQVLTAWQKRNDERKLLFSQVNARFIAEITKQNPDWSTTYDDIIVIINQQPALVNALNNIVSLTEDIHLLTGIIGERAKKQQILALMSVIPMWATAI